MGFIGGVGFVNIDLMYSGLERLPEKGEEIYSKRFEMHLGGGIPASLINTRRLGVPSRIITFLGKDLFSGYAQREFDSYGTQVVNLYQGEGMPVTVSTAMIFSEDRSFLSYRDEVEITGEIREQIYQHLKGARVVDMQPGFLDVYKKLKQEGYDVERSQCSGNAQRELNEKRSVVFPAAV